MGNSKLTFVFAVLGPLMLGSGACFLSTEGERYDDTFIGFESDGSSGACAVGAPGCPCTGSGVCDPGLLCVGMLNTCVVPSDCDVGAAGCSCTEGGTCDPGLICKEDYCVSEAPCLPDFIGTQGCQCTMGGGCDDQLECLSGLCVDTSGVTSGETTTGNPATSEGSGPTTASGTTTGDDASDTDASDTDSSTGAGDDGGSSTGSDLPTTSAGGG